MDALGIAAFCGLFPKIIMAADIEREPAQHKRWLSTYS
jgi:hypothetical protein